MRFHWQNLNDTIPPKPVLHGRCWFWVHNKPGVQLCWYTPKLSCGVSFSRGPCLHIAIPLIGALWVTCNDDHSDTRELSIEVHNGSVWWNLWTDKYSWSRETPKWRNGSFNPFDFFLGSRKHTVVDTESRDVLVPLPECAYRGKATVQLRTWRRARWPFAKHARTVTIDMADGESLPIMGKGENSWDCGEDSIHAGSYRADTIEDAIGQMVASALKTRRRHGTPERVQKAIGVLYGYTSKA